MHAAKARKVDKTGTKSIGLYLQLRSSSFVLDGFAGLECTDIGQTNVGTKDTVRKSEFGLLTLPLQVRYVVMPAVLSSFAINANEMREIEAHVRNHSNPKPKKEAPQGSSYKSYVQQREALIRA